MSIEGRRYEPVIGLEVHTHLATDSKLFSPAPVRYGDLANHDVHPIDLGMPGVLPVLNQRVVELAIRLGIALHATVNTRSIFARKNYFYPDLPKGYQISQYEDPVVSEGWLDIQVPLGPDSEDGGGSRNSGRFQRQSSGDGKPEAKPEPLPGELGVVHPTYVCLSRRGACHKLLHYMSHYMIGGNK